MNKILERLQRQGAGPGGILTARIERMSMKKMAVYAGILLAVSLLPLLVLGRYNVMCADDYDYGRAVHDTWLATGSVWQSVRTAWQQNMTFYRDWQGTYVSCFLMALSPMNFRYESAWVVPVVMIGMFASSTFLLGKHILCRWLGAQRAGGCFVMCLLLFMFYQVLEAPYEGIYWYNGATHYVLMQSIWFFTLAAISASFWAQKRAGEVVFVVIAACLSVIVGGGNLVTGLQAGILLAFMLVYAVVVNRRKIAAVAVPFVTGTAGFLLNILAPGNTRRSSLDMDEGYSAVLSVLMSFYNAVVYMIRWTPVFVILVWLLMLPVLWKLMKESRQRFGHPVLVTLGAFCVLAAMFTPTLFALGMVGLSRVDNIIQMVYYLCLFLVTAYWMGYFSHREGHGAGEALGLFLEKAGGRMTAAFMVLVLVVWVFTGDKNTYASISAARSVYNGEAKTFHAEAMERHEVYVDERIVDVELKPYSARPALFDFQDLSEDAGNWLNLAVMQYYHKAYVKIVEE